MDEWTTVERRVAYSCAGFDVINEQVALPDGDRTEFDYLAEGESVVVLPFTAAGEVVVIDEWRHAVGRHNRGLPAGSIESDEPPAAAVARELREETGYTTDDVEHLHTVEPANGFADSVFHYYVARDCHPAGEQSLDADETIEVTTTDLDSLRAEVRNGELRDGRSVLGVLFYLLAEGDL